MPPDLTDREVEVEALMARMGYERYWSQLNAAKEKGEYALRTDTGRYLLREMVWDTRDLLDKWVKEATRKTGFVKSRAYSRIKEIGTGVCSLIACKMLLDQISITRSFPSLCMATGSRLQDELIFRAIRNDSELLFEKMLTRTERGGYQHRRTVMVYTANKRKIDLPRSERNTMARMGVIVLECACEASAMFERELRRGPRSKKVLIHASPEVLDWIDKSQDEHEMLRPFYMPTVDVPLAWEGLHGGGYHTDVVLRRPLVKFDRWAHEKRARPADYALTGEACNALAEVAWEANELVYVAASTLWANHVTCPMLPTRSQKPLPEKPTDIATNDDARLRWRREAALTYTENIAETGRRVGTARTLFVSRTYQELGRQPFYFPHYSDFRGRIYARPLFLDPQGTDLARALLRFHRPKKIGPHGLSWLAIHGANCFGLDKQPFEERIDWCHEHRREIEAVHRDPLDSRAWWQDAEKPWQFLAFCEAWADAVSEGEDYACRIPVHVDGTNNGWQIYALLSRDPVGAEITNVLPGPAPRDAYAEVAAIATEMLKTIAAGNATGLAAVWRKMSDREAMKTEMGWARRILDACGGKLPREGVKRTTLSKTYGLRRWSADKYVRVYLDTVAPEDWAGTYQPAHLLGPVVWNSIKARTGRAAVVMDWLRELAMLMAKAGFPLCWNSPTGFGVIQDYRRQKRDTIETAIHQSLRRSVNLRRPLRQIAVMAQTDGFAPNYVHSLDAACLTKIVIKMKAAGLESFTTVHDGFSSHACDVGTMGAIIRQVYASVFQEDQLRLVKRQLEYSSGLDLPEPPAYGDLDPACIMESRYAFS